VAKRACGVGVGYLITLFAVLAGEAGAQTIVATPRGLVFSAITRGPNPPPQTVAVSNAASGSLTWQVTGTRAPWLTVTPRQGTAPSSLTFSVSTVGMRAGMYYDKVPVASNDPATPTDTIPVVLRITDQPSNMRPAVYEVEFSMSGYAGELNGAPQCKVRLNGTDRMVGIVIGVETPESDEDVVYYGLLRRDTDMDYCLTKGRKRPGDDERVWCSLTLKGWAATSVEMTVHSDSARGGYLKSEAVPGYSSAGIPRTTCDPQETRDAANGYADTNDGGGGSPNGQQIDDRQGQDARGRGITFVSGGVPRLRVGTFPPENPSGWTLRVIRKIQ